MAAVLVILAHQGGWDEMLMVAGPIIVFALILRAANRRAERRAAELAGPGPGPAVAETIEDQSSTSTSAPNDASRPGRSS